MLVKQDKYILHFSDNICMLLRHITFQANLLAYLFWMCYTPKVFEVGEIPTFFLERENFYGGLA